MHYWGLFAFPLLPASPLDLDLPFIVVFLALFNLATGVACSAVRCDVLQKGGQSSFASESLYPIFIGGFYLVYKQK